eukprot:TRINITY_DN7340_c0_g2_i5.p1 TRINITY_DN7340_c0_g2~~TRINITY_DN7340_c0_g2_i5.p1  ORF type:complete len:105 (-),score=0.46 TRINITY_DN7340_c0_g2_i5:991-1305(-)
MIFSPSPQFAKGTFPDAYVPTVFENYTASMKHNEKPVLLHLVCVVNHRNVFFKTRSSISSTRLTFFSLVGYSRTRRLCKCSSIKQASPPLELKSPFFFYCSSIL